MVNFYARLLSLFIKAIEIVVIGPICLFGLRSKYSLGLSRFDQNKQRYPYQNDQ